MAYRSILAAAVCLGGCIGPEEETEPEPTPPRACVAGEITADDGSCVPAGVPEEACAVGFQSDGLGGCVAMLPPAPCTGAQLALPGEAACRPLVDCGQGDYGNIPVDGGTEHVNAAYAGGGSDGSAAAPWTTIGAAVSAAAPGAIVAVAAGTYTENVVVQDMPVRIWGRCPDLVEVVGTANPGAIRVNVTGTEIHALAVRGVGGGIVVLGATNVLLEGIYAHDNAWHGIHIEDYYADASATLRNALIERASAFGLYVFGGDAVVEDVAIRDTIPAGFGYGIQVEDKEGARGTLSVTHAIVERSSTIGIGNVGSDLTVNGTLIRDTFPNAAGFVGRGIDAEDNPFTGAPASLVVDASVVELSRDHGIYLAGVTATISNTVVRDTLPEAATGEFGRALNVLADYDNGNPSNVTLRSSTFERNRDAGIGLFGSTLDAELLVVRDTYVEEATQFYGYGIVLQHQVGLRANCSLRNSVVQNSGMFGVVALGSDVQVLATNIVGTLSNGNGIYGDGVTAMQRDGFPATGVIGNGTVIANSARAGVSAFGGTVTLDKSHLECNVLDLHSEPFDGVDSSFTDAGSNVCSCMDEERVCKSSTSSLEPPEPLPAN